MRKRGKHKPRRQHVIRRNESQYVLTHLNTGGWEIEKSRIWRSEGARALAGQWANLCEFQYTRTLLGAIFWAIRDAGSPR